MALSTQYLEHMNAHVDAGGQLDHRNGIDLLAEIARLTAERDRLREVLKPFVAWGVAYPRPRISVSPEDTIIVSASDVHITLGDLDRARAALAQDPSANCAPDASDMRAFGASDAACYKWPDDTLEHRALRSAYISGAADYGGPP